MSEQEVETIIERDGERFVLTARTDPPLSVSGDSPKELADQLRAKIGKGVAAGEIRILPPERHTPSPPIPEELNRVFGLAHVYSDKWALTRLSLNADVFAE